MVIFASQLYIKTYKALDLHDFCKLIVHDHDFILTMPFRFKAATFQHMLQNQVYSVLPLKIDLKMPEILRIVLLAQNIHETIKFSRIDPKNLPNFNLKLQLFFLVSLDGSDRRNLFGPDTRDSRTQEIGSKGFIKGIQIQEEKVTFYYRPDFLRKIRCNTYDFQVFWASNNLYYISIENGATKIVYADKNIGKLSSLKARFQLYFLLQV